MQFFRYTLPETRYILSTLNKVSLDALKGVWQHIPMPHLINLTPHIVQIQAEDDNGNPVVVSIPPSGDIARIETYDRGEIGTISNFTVNDGLDKKLKYPNTHIRIRVIQYKRLVLPHPKNGVIYIVSRIVAKYAADRGRIDVLFPGPTINGIKQLRNGLIKTL